MHLTLELLDGPDAGAARSVDGSHAFSVGTTPGVTWALSGTGGDAAVTIRRTAGGFEMDVQGDVSIEHQAITDGTTVPVAHGSLIGIAGLGLRASLAQPQSTPLLASAVGAGSGPTISSILSDITPGGDTAQGPLPGRGGEAWLDQATQDRDQNDSRADWGSLGSYGARPAAPAWQDTATPQTGKGLSTFLPDDWDTPSDRQNRVTQSRAVSSAAGLTRDEPAKIKPKSRRQPVAVRAFFEAAGLVPEELEALDAGDLKDQMANAGAALRLMLDAVSELEASHARARSEMDIAPPEAPTHDRTAVDPLMVLADRDGTTLSALRNRIDMLSTSQTGLIDAVSAHLGALSDTLDPAMIKAQVASTGGFGHRIAPAASAWRLYEELWHQRAPLATQTLAQAAATHLSNTRSEEPD